MKRREFITHVIAAGGFALASGGVSVFAQERVYLTEAAALKLVFPTSGNIAREQRNLDDAQAAVVERTLGFRLQTHSELVFRGETGGTTDGYAMIMNEVGKDQPITFIVGISREFKLQRIALMIFRETRGWEVQDARFTNQFRGKTGHDRLLVGSDIIGVTGATLSSRAFCRGAKKALLICEALYKR